MAKSNQCLDVKHTYKKHGIYKVTLTGDCDNLYGHGEGSPGSYNAKNSYAVRYWLWGVVVPKNSWSPLKYGYGSFFGAQGLKYIGYGVFHNITNCRELPHLLDGAVLDKIEKWILWGGYNLEKLDYTFENCQMRSIDPQLFQNCPKVTSMFHTFHRCDRLQEIPQGLFDFMPNLKNVDTCFKSCVKLQTVPYDLFNRCPNINNFSSCFCGGGAIGGDVAYPSNMNITSSLPPAWITHPNAQHYKYAAGCTMAENYKIAVTYGWA